MNTNNWQEYQLEINGVKFISKVDPKGSFYPQIEKLPEGILNQWHSQMVNELIGDVSTMPREAIQERLDEINAGATQALLCLV